MSSNFSQSQYMIELHRMDGCTTKCGFIGLILFRYLQSLGTIVCNIKIIGFVSVYACRVCVASVASCASVH